MKDIEDWLQEEIEPQAQVIDQQPEALFAAFHQMGDRNLLGLRLPESDGGRGWSPLQDSQFQVLLASYSGALAFLSTQHQSAIRMIAASENQGLKGRMLPALLQGGMSCGVGFSHLRRRGTAMVTATPSAHGYCLEGTVPWVTGYGCFDGFIGGALLPDGQFLMAWVPFSRPDSPSMTISIPQALAAMAVTQTVSVQLHSYCVSQDDVVAIHPQNWLQEKDRVNTLHHGFYALGAARGALRLMQKLNPKSGSDPVIESAIASFKSEYDRCEQRMFALLPLRQSLPEECLATKARVHRLAGRVSQAAVALSGGGANHLSHAAQRIYREVLAFTVFGQTYDAKRATLAALSASVSWEELNHPCPAPSVEV